MSDEHRHSFSHHFALDAGTAASWQGKGAERSLITASGNWKTIAIRKGLTLSATGAVAAFMTLRPNGQIQIRLRDLDELSGGALNLKLRLGSQKGFRSDADDVTLRGPILL